MEINLTLHIEKYIAHPFWPAQKQVIEIHKKSGMNMARGETKRNAALQAELDKRSLSREDYEKLLAQSETPFHRLGDGRIYIPARNVESFIAHVAQLAPRAMRAVAAANAHSSTRISEPGLVTDKREPDGEFTRFVKLEMSNERSLQSNAYIADFQASGKMILSDGIRKDELLRMIEWGGQEIGIGAARSQGYGRFTVVRFD
jgi:hypothetical protein